VEFDCTEEEFRILEKLVMEEDFVGSFQFYLLLVLLGVKPGAKPSTRHELEEYREEIEEMGLHIKRLKLDFVDLEELPEYAVELEYDRPYFVARDQERLEMLKDRYSEDEEEEYDRDFALFLGYPEEDVKWFVKATDGHSDAYEKSKEKLGDPEDFEKVVRTVMYVPKPTQECYERARKTAERYVEAIKEADRKFGSEAGETLMDAQLNR